MSMSTSFDLSRGSGEASTLTERDERSLGRAELDQLREKERDILDQLHHIRTVTATRRDQIRASCPTSADLISHLPAEVLLLIIELVLQSPLVGCDPHHHIKRELASLSRRWRNLILNSPSLWNRIRICEPWDVPFVKAHVARSAECPLDVEICMKDWDDCDWSAINDRLIVVIRCRHRWRSLVLRTTEKDLIISCITFAWWFIPFKRLTIIDDGLSDPFRFSPNVDWSSVDYLELQTRVNLNCLSNLSGLKTLLVRIPHVGSPPTHVAFSLLKLKTLSLSGYTGDLHFCLETLHFPLLDSLSVNVTHARELMEAIAAPTLRHVCYTPYSCDNDMSSIFGNLSSKFLSVERLSLCDYTELWQTARNTNVKSAQAVSKAFPNARHVELHARHVEAFFDTEATCPADGWEHLQVLKIQGLFGDEISTLKEWLRRRNLEGKPVLDVTMIDIPSIFSDSRRFAIYESFRPYCNVVVPLGLDPTSSLSSSDIPWERLPYSSASQASSTLWADDDSKRRCEFCIGT
ncbi:hypothetical protein EDD17DRAFT_1644631 [Pisolithus thermaeus]|nr:hypothetical protein EDD17DRAFT_1644631 [Pisolithus thermaeus]